MNTKQIDETVNADQTITVTFRGESRTFESSSLSNSNYFMAHNVFSGKFRSGTKLWPLGLYIWGKSGNVCTSNGGFSNKGGVASIVGWWNTDSKANTQHKGAM